MQLQDTQKEMGKTYEDLEFLLACLNKVLVRSGRSDLAKVIPWINDISNFGVEDLTEDHIHLFTVCFHLLNIAEENGVVQIRRSMENQALDSINGLWANNLQKLSKAGVTPEKIAELIRETYVEPVLTAHPTEAKQPTVLELHRELYLYW